MPQVNTDLCRSFKKIVTGGWAQHSNGDVESPTGHFAYIPISINELVELSAACLDDDDDVPIEGQYYVFIEDSDGNGILYIYGSSREALDHFNQLTAEYERWRGEVEDEDYYLVCDECGEAFELSQQGAIAAEQHELTTHGLSGKLSSDGYRIKPESEAL